MAYNSEMMALDRSTRSITLGAIYMLPANKATTTTKHDCIGGSYEFAYVSKKALDILNRIDKAFVPKLAQLCKSNRWYDAYCSLRKIGLKKNNLIPEHTIPCSVALRWLEADNRRQTAKVFESLFASSILVQCAVTKDEDRLLVNAHLNSKMPKSWDGFLNKDATFARYREVGIEPIELTSLI